jgi:hypothetical protein
MLLADYKSAPFVDQTQEFFAVELNQEDLPTPENFQSFKEAL